MYYNSWELDPRFVAQRFDRVQAFLRSIHVPREDKVSAEARTATRNKERESQESRKDNDTARPHKRKREPEVSTSLRERRDSGMSHQRTDITKRAHSPEVGRKDRLQSTTGRGDRERHAKIDNQNRGRKVSGDDTPWTNNRYNSYYIHNKENKKQQENGEQKQQESRQRVDAHLQDRHIRTKAEMTPGPFWAADAAGSATSRSDGNTEQQGLDLDVVPESKHLGDTEEEIFSLDTIPQHRRPVMTPTPVETEQDSLVLDLDIVPLRHSSDSVRYKQFHRWVFCCLHTYQLNMLLYHLRGKEATAWRSVEY